MMEIPLDQSVAAPECSSGVVVTSGQASDNQPSTRLMLRRIMSRLGTKMK